MNKYHDEIEVAGKTTAGRVADTVTPVESDPAEMVTRP
jgi:hypothetical protein